jgi:hypothetical protein
MPPTHALVSYICHHKTMRNLFKHIALLFLLTAGVLISAHALIPHHHHFEVSATNCPEEHDAANHQEHCTLFNEVVLDAKLIKQLQWQLNPVVLEAFFELIAPDNPYPFVFIEGEKLISQKLHTKHSPTRGSPQVFLI